jgi:hypothetical protein
MSLEIRIASYGGGPTDHIWTIEGLMGTAVVHNCINLK